MTSVELVSREDFKRDSVYAQNAYTNLDDSVSSSNVESLIETIEETYSKKGGDKRWCILYWVAICLFVVMYYIIHNRYNDASHIDNTDYDLYNKTLDTTYDEYGYGHYTSTLLYNFTVDEDVYLGEDELLSVNSRERIYNQLEFMRTNNIVYYDNKDPNVNSLFKYKLKDYKSMYRTILVIFYAVALGFVLFGVFNLKK